MLSYLVNSSLVCNMIIIARENDNISLLVFMEK